MGFIIILFLCFVFLGILLSILFLLKKSGDRLANRILALYTFLFAFELLNNALRWSGEINSAAFVHLNLAHFPLWTIYGPLVYIYVRRVIKGVGLQFRDLFFMLPTIVIVATLFPFYKLGTAKKIKIVTTGSAFDHIPRAELWHLAGNHITVLLCLLHLFQYF